ncbi:hypothetical protein BaRGS_00038681 [Batillaria attramentaria]|uniref:Uncharacterized protein n=1 Tax=Batillaria attramentaria TaxID=370345 RepID=A0ABD0J565_9CAEN
MVGHLDQSGAPGGYGYSQLVTTTCSTPQNRKQSLFACSFFFLSSSLKWVCVTEDWRILPRQHDLVDRGRVVPDEVIGCCRSFVFTSYSPVPPPTLDKSSNLSLVP